MTRSQMQVLFFRFVTEMDWELRDRDLISGTAELSIKITENGQHLSAFWDGAVVSLTLRLAPDVLPSPDTDMIQPVLVVSPMFSLNGWQVGAKSSHINITAESTISFRREVLDPLMDAVAKQREAAVSLWHVLSK